jgi:hypothetical protein
MGGRGVRRGKGVGGKGGREHDNVGRIDLLYCQLIVLLPEFKSLNKIFCFNTMVPLSKE